MQQEFWNFIHNAIAHPLMAVTQLLNAVTEKFHDYTADKLD
jgi:hypothetical protein